MLESARGVISASLALLGWVTEPAARAADAVPAKACFQGIVEVLADDDMQGRGVGTDGLARSARYLAERFAAIGLHATASGYTQPFETVTGVALGQESSLEWGSTQAEPSVGFTPLGFSSSGEFSGPVVFVGYGIRAETLGYDDYAGLDEP